MIKNVAYFPSQCALNSGPILTALKFSLGRAGIRIVENSMDCDAALIWSVLWAGRMKQNQTVYNHYRSENRPVICIDIGTLFRGYTWKIAVNNINGLGYYGHRNNLDFDRPKKLGLELKQPANGSHILVAAQHRNSLQLQGVDQEAWISDKIRCIQEVTDRPIIVRSHPRCPVDINKLPKGTKVEKPAQILGTYDSFDINYGCHAVINYNSGPGIQAAINGTRPIVDQSSLAAPVSIGIENIEQPYDCDRELWLTEIAHTEYTVLEIQQGLWVKRIELAL